MQNSAKPGLVDRWFGGLEAAPIRLGQILYRLVLRRSKKGRGSADYQADIAEWMRRGQQGECSPAEAEGIFGLAAAHWAFLAGMGVVAGMALDYFLGVPFDLVLAVSLSVFPAFALASGADALRSHQLAARTTAPRRGRSDDGVTYTPIRNRWAVFAAASILLASVWVAVFSASVAIVSNE
ncbi:hypothetical protein ACIQGZ_25450 [Streptomyces sp. NPDC092296]|uniref:hypothetical protein n=1 Tax=Streptomyces sp. NPDC092296 TaxID=3366012 RepID=UPI00382524A5